MIYLRHSIQSTLKQQTQRFRAGTQRFQSSVGINFDDPDCNVTENIASRIGTDLHNTQNHPIHTLKTIIHDYWKEKDGGFQYFDNLSPIVANYDNFDSLLIPSDHVSRSKSDTYYVNKDNVLRTHTTAHDFQLLKEGYDKFLITGEVYR